MTREKILNEARFGAQKEMLLTASLVAMSSNGYVLVGALDEGGAFENTHETQGIEPEAPVHVFLVDVGGNALHISTDPASDSLIPVGELLN